MELLGFKPKTFVVKGHLDMMKPSIQVEMDHPDRQDSVTEVHIRDWKLQPLMLHTLCRCFEKLHKLHTIALWRVAPDAELIRQLGQQLQQLATVKSLSLECSGAVPEENFADLLRPDTSLTKLQLRFNGITDKGAALIASQLYGLQEPPSKIVSLDLSCNRIGDDGAIALAKNLRTNRSLIHLSLSNNAIGDAGAASLAEVCSRFFLAHEEIVERRKLLSVDSGSGSSVSFCVLPDAGDQLHAHSNSSSHLSAEPDRDSRHSRPTSSVITPPPSRKGADRPGSVRSQEKGDKKTVGKATKGKKEEKGRADDKGKGKGQKDEPKGKGKGAAAAADKDGKAALRSGKGRGNRVKVSTPQQEPEQQPEVQFDSDHPLLEKADASYARGYLLIPGNYVLALLNLSRNQIGDAGIAAWKTAVRYQAAYMAKNKVKGTGLLKLRLEGNQFAADTDNFKSLEEAMTPRNPLKSSASD